MFVLKPRGDDHDTAWCRVVVDVPTDDGATQHRIEVQYRLLRQSEIDAAYAELDADAIDDTVSVTAFLGRVIADWRGIAREVAPGRTEPIECNPDALAELCDVLHVRRALLDGFFLAVSGRSTAARARRHRKNS